LATRIPGVPGPDLHELVDSAGRARSAEDHDVVVRPVDRAVDQPPRVLAQPRRLEPGRGRLGVRVRVQRQHLVADEILDEAQCGPEAV
jgi:hypothetical protein